MRRESEKEEEEAHWPATKRALVCKSTVQLRYLPHKQSNQLASARARLVASLGRRAGLARKASASCAPPADSTCDGSPFAALERPSSPPLAPAAVRSLFWPSRSSCSPPPPPKSSRFKVIAYIDIVYCRLLALRRSLARRTNPTSRNESGPAGAPISSLRFLLSFSLAAGLSVCARVHASSARRPKSAAMRARVVRPRAQKQQRRRLNSLACCNLRLCHSRASPRRLS